MKGRSIAAFAIFLESAAFTSQTIEVRATEGHFYDNRGMPSDQRDRWKSSASIGSAALEGKRYDVAIRFLSAALDGAVKSEDAAHLHGFVATPISGKEIQTRRSPTMRGLSISPRKIPPTTSCMD